MPWTKCRLEAVSAGLRKNAEEGRFVPFNWVDSYDHQGGCGGMTGCGWGVVGYITSLMMNGFEQTREILPEGACQYHVDSILMSAGLTPAEIELMNPRETWECFDGMIELSYDNRSTNWNAFITQSKIAAEYFIRVLERVPVVDDSSDVRTVTKSVWPLNWRGVPVNQHTTPHLCEVEELSEA